MEQINIVCIPNFTSYGNVSTNLIKQLDQMGIRVNLFPISQQGIEAYPEDHELIRKCLANAQLFDFNSPSVRVWHQFALDMYPGRGLRAGFPIFELDRFNELELHHLKNQDVILTCSSWGKQVIEENKIGVPTKVVPLGVDTNIFFPSDNKTTDGPTKFFMVGKKELRKNFDTVLTAFEKAFSVEDNIELHLFWHNRILEQTNPKEDKAWDDYFSKSKLTSKFYLYSWLFSQMELANKIRRMDCGLFVSRAEGFDLGLLESLSCARQVVVSNYSGHTEFANSSNSMLVDINETELAYDNIWFHGQGSWAKIGKPQEEQIINHLRSVHKRKQEGSSLFNQEGVLTAKCFTWEETARKLIEALS